MPIRVKCECGHEITVSDSMAGKKGRCPECDAVISIPSKGEKHSRGGAFTPPPHDRHATSFGYLSFFSGLLATLGLLLLLAFAGIGVYTGVTAFRGGDAFHSPLGLFAGCAVAARENPILVGVAFIVGGLLVGAFSALVLLAVSQAFRLFMVLDRHLDEISQRLRA